MFNPAAYAGLEGDSQSRLVWVDYTLVREMIYADCDEETIDAAIKRLRPQSTHANTIPCSLTEYPAVPCTSVVCTDDRALRLEPAKRLAARRGGELVELPGSHSPFFSMPEALAEVLLRVAAG